MAGDPARPNSPLRPKMHCFSGENRPILPRGNHDDTPELCFFEFVCRFLMFAHGFGLDFRAELWGLNVFRHQILFLI